MQEQNITFLQLDHPGANDAEYRKRRDHIAQLAHDFHANQQPIIPVINYTQEENETWATITGRLQPLHQKFVSSLHLKAQKELNLFTQTIPQLADVSKKLQEKTGMKLAPIQGLINSQNFLEFLDANTMLCTQYIRHSSKPEYTPEPDIVHELIGHVAAFTNTSFVEFSRLIGRMAKQANSDQLIALERLYWFTIEFGLIKEQQQNKAFGAGLLSSLGELPHALSSEVETRPFSVDDVISTDYDYSTMQPVLFVINSFEQLVNETKALAKQMGITVK